LSAQLFTGLPAELLHMSQCPPPCPPNCATLYPNNAQTAVVKCDAGVPFSWTVPYDTLRRLSQLQADFDAAQLAKQLANRNKICFITTELPVGRVGTEYSDVDGQPVQIKAKGGTPWIFPDVSANAPLECFDADNEPPFGTPVPYHYEVIDGALPDGLSFDCFGFLKGAPHHDGNFTFTVKITDAIGTFQRQQFEIVVGCVTDPITYQASGYLYFQLATGAPAPAGWQRMKFDARSWRVGQGAFGQRGDPNCALQGTVNTAWNSGTDLLIRKKFKPGTIAGMELFAAVDNDILEVWFNGKQMTGLPFRHDFCPHLDDFHKLLPDGVIGTNLLAIRVSDRGGESFFDMRVKVNCP
jgi:hypothetical protein